MPRYYFHVHDHEVCLDEDGQELSNLDAAQVAAIKGARELACAELMRGELHLEHSIELVDGCGKVVSIISFGDAAGIPTTPEETRPGS